MPLVVLRGRCLLWRPRYPLGTRSLGTLIESTIEQPLINYFWKLQPDECQSTRHAYRLQTIILTLVYQVSHAVDLAARTLPPLETTLPAGHAILRCLHPSLRIRMVAYKLFLEATTRLWLDSVLLH